MSTENSFDKLRIDALAEVFDGGTEVIDCVVGDEPAVVGELEGVKGGRLIGILGPVLPEGFLQVGCGEAALDVTVQNDSRVALMEALWDCGVVDHESAHGKEGINNPDVHLDGYVSIENAG